MKKLFRKMNKILFYLLSVSGKGGTGKTTFDINLAVLLAIRGYLVGILDADITGPSSAKMTGTENAKLVVDERLNPAIFKYKDKIKIKQMSTSYLLPDKNIPVVWEGRGKQEAIRLSIKSINWGKLDFLCIDTPPGTSDEILSVFNNVDKDKTGMILVTQPQGMSILDCRKAITMARLANIHILGAIENMRDFKCPSCRVISKKVKCPCCGELTEIFLPGEKEISVKQLCIEKKIPYLGRLPIDPILCKEADEGNPFLLIEDENFNKIANRILIQIDKFKKLPKKKKRRSKLMLGWKFLKFRKKLLKRK